MRAWFSDVMKIALGLWAVGTLAIMLTLIFFDYTFPVIQSFAIWLANDRQVKQQRPL